MQPPVGYGEGHPVHKQLLGLSLVESRFFVGEHLDDFSHLEQTRVNGMANSWKEKLGPLLPGQGIKGCMREPYGPPIVQFFVNPNPEQDLCQVSGSSYVTDATVHWQKRTDFQ
jgi:hypothetical protein